MFPAKFIAGHHPATVNGAGICGKRPFFIMEKLINWLKDHDLISINMLEQRAGIPQRNLHKVLNRQRPLPEKYIQPLVKELKKYGYK